MTSPRLRAVRDAVALAVCMSSLSTTSHAQGPSCTTTRLDPPETSAAAWSTAARLLAAELTLLEPSECVDARLELVFSDGRATLRVHTGDGRTAERTVRRPADLVPIAIGLIAAAPRDGSPPPTADLPSPQELPPRDERPVVVKPPPAPPPATLSVSGGARLLLPTGAFSPEIELRADVRYSALILGLSGRGAFFGARPFATKIPGYELDVYSFGAFAGARVHADGFDVDVTSGPRLAISTEEGDVPEDGTGGTRTDLELEGTLRVLLGRGRLRPFGSVGVSVLPLRVFDPAHVDARLPALPWLSGSLSVGVAGDGP